jgi:hypothetical protein
MGIGTNGAGHGTSLYGKTLGVIVTPGTSSSVKFVESDGKKALDQRIVGVIKD